MKDQSTDTTKVLLDVHQNHWERIFVEKHNMFGIEPSYPARKAIELLKKEGKRKILELGGGQGRDTLFFACKRDNCT